MSYSFSVSAATKQEAIQKVADELAKVVAAQPVHSADQDQVNAAVNGFADSVLADDDAHDVHISVNGHLTSVNGDIHAVGVSISLGLVKRK